MKYIATVTLQTGAHVECEVDGECRRSAAAAAVRSVQGAVKASARPAVSPTQYVRDVLAERMSGFPIISGFGGLS